MSQLPLLRLLHLASPALPIGGFHFSQGLEYAVECGWVSDEASALDWIGGIARKSVGTLDLPLVVRLHAAWSEQNLEQVRHWSDRLIAARETNELRAEDRHLGSSLARILIDLNIAASTEIAKESTSFGSMFALACVRSGASAAEAVSAYLWVWAENQTLAAVKLVPLGQSAGQRILHSLLPQLDSIAAAALHVSDSEIGTSALMQFFASARHETQYTRLFRS
jgi:urease accessory protein